MRKAGKARNRAVRLLPWRLTGMGVLTVLVACCGTRSARPRTVLPEPERPFPAVEVPAMLTGPEERMSYLVLHFWDAFTDTTAVRNHRSDSLHLAGISREAVEAQMGTWTTLLPLTPFSDAVRAVDRLYTRTEAVSGQDSLLFDSVCALVKKYLYDPNSPVRDEDLYAPFVERLAMSDRVPEAQRLSYAWEARMCGRNRTGTPAADFVFVDTGGRRRTLYGIRAEYTLLVFGNPGCAACVQLVEQMAASPQIVALQEEGRLQVVDIYIDDEIDAWKAHTADYPTAWVNGYDPMHRIRRDLIYHVRAIPSLYLLDRDKTVLLKDAPQERLLTVLSAL